MNDDRIYGISLQWLDQTLRSIQGIGGYQYSGISLQSIRRTGVSTLFTNRCHLTSSLVPLYLPKVRIVRNVFYSVHSTCLSARPEECPTIKSFAIKKGVEFTMMDKVDVNGVGAHPVYHYLKKVAGPVSINVFCVYYIQ